MNFHLALRREKNTQRRRHLAAGIQWRCAHDLEVRAQHRTSVLTSVSPLICSEIDKVVRIKLIQIVHALCLCDADVPSLLANNTSLFVAPLVNSSFTSIVMPFLLLLPPFSTLDLSTLNPLCCLLSTLYKSTNEASIRSDDTQSQQWEQVKTWVRKASEQDALSLPLLHLLHCMHMGKECAPSIVSRTIVSDFGHRALFATFLRSIVSNDAMFHHQWSATVIIFLLYTYCMDSDRNAKQCLNILWCRPRTGLGAVIMLLLSNTIEVESLLWKNISATLCCDQHDDGAGRVKFHAIRSRGSSSQGGKIVSVIVRYGNELQKSNVARMCIHILQSTVLVYSNHLDLETSGSSSSKDQISLSVLAGVQALLRVSMTEDVDHVLIRLCRASLIMGKYVVRQLDQMYSMYSTTGREKNARGKDLLRQLSDEVALMEKNDDEDPQLHAQHKPCRPASGMNRRSQLPRRKYHQLMVKRSASVLGNVSKTADPRLS